MKKLLFPLIMLFIALGPKPLKAHDHSITITFEPEEQYLLPTTVIPVSYQGLFKSDLPLTVTMEATGFCSESVILHDPDNKTVILCPQYKYIGEDYTISLTATDITGNSATASFKAHIVKDWEAIKKTACELLDEKEEVLKQAKKIVAEHQKEYEEVIKKALDNYDCNIEEHGDNLEMIYALREYRRLRNKLEKICPIYDFLSSFEGGYRKDLEDAGYSAEEIEDIINRTYEEYNASSIRKFRENYTKRNSNYKSFRKLAKDKKRIQKKVDRLYKKVDDLVINTNEVKNSKAKKCLDAATLRMKALANAIKCLKEAKEVIKSEEDYTGNKRTELLKAMTKLKNACKTWENYLKDKDC